MHKINHKIMGELKFHDTYGWWEGKVTLPQDRTSILYLKCSKDNSDEIDGLADRYEGLVENLELYKTEVADKLIKASGGRMENVPKERIVEKLKIYVIEIIKDGSAAIFFNDGNPATSRIAVAEINKLGDIISIEVMGE